MNPKEEIRGVLLEISRRRAPGLPGGSPKLVATGHINQELIIDKQSTGIAQFFGGHLLQVALQI